MKLNLRSKRTVIFQFKMYWRLDYKFLFLIGSCILLQKFDISSKKEMKVIKTQILW